jgi:transcription elongation factor SPT4
MEDAGRMDLDRRSPPREETKRHLVDPPTTNYLRRVDHLIRAGVEKGKRFDQEQKDAALARRLYTGAQDPKRRLGRRKRAQSNPEVTDLEGHLELLDPKKYPRHAPGVKSPTVPTHSENRTRKRFAERVVQAREKAPALNPSPPKLVPDAPFIKANNYAKVSPGLHPLFPDLSDRPELTSPTKKPTKKKTGTAKLKPPKDLHINQLKPGTISSIYNSIELQEKLSTASGSNSPERRNMSDGMPIPHYNQPHQTRSLRACMVCTIVLTQSEFVASGCPNCENVLELKGSPDTVNECTSSNFNGTLALMNPERSWVGKWQRLEGYVPGIYAVQVIGTLPEEVVDAVRSAGMRYVPRDGRKEDGEEADM